MTRLRRLAKRALYRSGALSAWQRRRCRSVLTVAMFHRVLPPGSPLWRDADPSYTVAEPVLAEFLRLCRRHYSLVSLAAVLAAARGGPPLPERPLLVTFDDGWADTLGSAAPVLGAAEAPAVVFVAADAVEDPAPAWWQETVFAAARHRRLDTPALRALVGGDAALDPFAVVELLARTDPDRRQSLLAPLRAAPPAGREMLDADTLRRLAASLEIGAHGATHVPLTMVRDPAAELVRAREALAGLAGLSAPPPSLSFPHGRYDAATVAAARAAGFDLLFTSDAVLNEMSEGRPGSTLLGRIPIDQSAICGADGRIAPELLLLWLAARPAALLGAAPPA